MENLDENRIEKIVKTRKQAHYFILKNQKYINPSLIWSKTPIRTEH